MAEAFPERLCLRAPVLMPGVTSCPKQLSMVVSAAVVRRLPLLPLPRGYCLRSYRPGDAGPWLDLLELAGFERWDWRKFEGYMREPERDAGSHCITADGVFVAAAFASRLSQTSAAGSLDYVIGHPRHRGRKLGRIVCRAVLSHLVDRGCKRVCLQTDDWRLPALQTYLQLGFRPVMTRIDMPVRWQAVYRRLGRA